MQSARVISHILPILQRTILPWIRLVLVLEVISVIVLFKYLFAFTFAGSFLMFLLKILGKLAHIQGIGRTVEHPGLLPARTTRRHSFNLCSLLILFKVIV